MAEMENEPRWHTDVLKVERLTEGEVREGTKYRFQLQPQRMGPPVGTVEIVAFEPGHRIVQQADMGRLKPKMTYVFDGEGDGTLVTRRITNLRSPPARSTHRP